MVRGGWGWEVREGLTLHIYNREGKVRKNSLLRVDEGRTDWYEKVGAFSIVGHDRETALYANDE